VDATAQFASDNGHTEFVRSVKCQETTSRGVRMPTITLPARPTADTDAVEDWEADMSALFEWVGMASLGAQRYVYISVEFIRY
jgi:ribonuclease P/MRP protein subunit RPP40